MTGSGTFAGAAVQIDSAHSKRENKARFEETSWHSPAEQRAARADKSSPSSSRRKTFLQVLLSQRYTIMFECREVILLKILVKPSKSEQLLLTDFSDGFESLNTFKNCGDLLQWKQVINTTTTYHHL